MRIRVEPAGEILLFIRMVCRLSIGRGRTQFSGLADYKIRYYILRLQTLYRQMG